MPLVRRSGSRALRAGLLVALCGTLVTLTALGAHAQSAPTDAKSSASLRADAEALSAKYFAALERVQSLDDELTRSGALVDDLTERAKEARAAVRARARLAYTSAGTQLSTLVESDDTLDSARRAHLIDHVNAREQDVYDELTRATEVLQKEQRALRQTRAAQADALDALKTQGAAIDAKLAQAEAQERDAAATQAAATATTTPPATVGAGPTGAPAPTSTTRPAAAAPSPPPSYSGTPGVSPHHQDPFLTCVRMRESGGNYSAVNPAGPYLGAYQFLQSTWNVTAAHAGRGDLVGVPANLASPYDQDEMAWALYQWQGKAPWGGSC
jgi:hypothetical protein